MEATYHALLGIPNYAHRTGVLHEIIDEIEVSTNDNFIEDEYTTGVISDAKVLNILGVTENDIENSRDWLTKRY